jgi:hypothetical protein
MSDPRKDTEIEPLSDEALEDVAGGSSGNCCSCSGCSSPPSDPPIDEGPIYV